ncbi:MAG TPA: hypothetical protein VEK56_04015 [Vicinamibacterales bacterium]|nr:hypothetical protein [Vicinamibacterales bacterium]
MTAQERLIRLQRMLAAVQTEYAQSVDAYPAKASHLADAIADLGVLIERVRSDDSPSDKRKDTAVA